MGAFDHLIPASRDEPSARGSGAFDHLIPNREEPPSGEANSTPTPSLRNWSDVPGEALRNIPESAAKFGEAIAHPFLHPQDTAESLGRLASSFMRWATPTPEIQKNPEDLAPAKAVGEFVAHRYGTEDGFKEALATDPVGVMADFATVLTGGGAAAARVPGVAGQAARIAGRVGAAIDPVTQAGNIVKLGAKGVEAATSYGLGFTTGAGAESVRAAGRAGMEGGEAAEAFTSNMRGQVPISDIVDRAKEALDSVRADRSEAYKAGMTNIRNDTTVLDFQPIEDALMKASEVGDYKGQVINRSARETMDKIWDVAGEWQGLDPKEFHTAEGFDALKRTIGDIRDSTEHGTPSRFAADRVYSAVRNEIEKQAPEYASVMAAYEGASHEIRELTRTFSLGERATDDTAARKLASTMRNNVQTNYGERARLLDVLGEHDLTLAPAIAGQAMNSLLPRGIVARGGAGLTAATNYAALPVFSPRIVGETVYLGGKAVGTIDDIASAFGITADHVRAASQGTFQTGRTAETVDARKMADDIMSTHTVGDAISAAQRAMNSP